MGTATQPLSAGVHSTGPYHGVTVVDSESGAKGILGNSTTGVYGVSASGYAGGFSGDVYVSGGLGVGRPSPSAVLDVADVVRVRSSEGRPGSSSPARGRAPPSIHLPEPAAECA